MTRRQTSGLLWFFAFCAVTSMAVEIDDYRLAGTLDTGARGWLAVLELPDGEQRLLKKGDTIADAAVIDIGDKWVRLRRDQDDLTLRLESGEPGISYGDVPPEFFNLQSSELLPESLDELVRNAENEEQLAVGISELLKIPGKGEVASIDDLPVKSAKHSLQLLRRSLVADHPVRIAVTGVDGFDAVYLMPDFEGDNKQ